MVCVLTDAITPLTQCLLLYHVEIESISGKTSYELAEGKGRFLTDIMDEHISELSTHEGIDMSKSSVWTYRKIRKNLAEFIVEKYRNENHRQTFTVVMWVKIQTDNQKNCRVLR